MNIFSLLSLSLYHFIGKKNNKKKSKPDITLCFFFVKKNYHFHCTLSVCVCVHWGNNWKIKIDDVWWTYISTSSFFFFCFTDTLHDHHNYDRLDWLNFLLVFFYIFLHFVLHWYVWFNNTHKIIASKCTKLFHFLLWWIYFVVCLFLFYSCSLVH